MAKKLPKTVYAYWKEYDKDEPVLLTTDKAEDALEGQTGTVRVGKYELVEEADVQAVPTVKAVKTHRKVE